MTDPTNLTPDRLDEIEAHADVIMLGKDTILALTRIARRASDLERERDDFLGQILAYRESEPYFAQQEVMKRENAALADNKRLMEALERAAKLIRDDLGLHHKAFRADNTEGAKAYDAIIATLSELSSRNGGGK